MQLDTPTNIGDQPEGGADEYIMMNTIRHSSILSDL